MNTVHDDQVGPIFEFLIENCHLKLTSVSFQPISFTGRDEGISDEERRRKRHTISHLAHELSRCFDGKIGVIVDTARGWNATLAQIGLSFLRNFDERKAPPGLSLRELLKMSNKKMGSSMSKKGRAGSSPWKFLWVGGMWFEDLWVYDFRRTEMCVIPYATREGEISFCAYNTGVGWRHIIENKYKTASVQDWFKEHGKHKVYGGNRAIDLG